MFTYKLKFITQGFSSPDLETKVEKTPHFLDQELFIPTCMYMKWDILYIISHAFNLNLS